MSVLHRCSDVIKSSLCDIWADRYISVIVLKNPHGGEDVGVRGEDGQRSNMCRAQSRQIKEEGSYIGVN